MARIQTNAVAINAHRNLANTGVQLERSIQKLSSGFRINRAKDDAAGLAIANRLRSDIRSMRQAQRNASQANSVLQIQDGALSTLSGILDRMKELATQAASDNSSASQRTTLHQEFADLRSEIDRIVNSTAYGGQNLLDGTFGASIDLATSTLDNVAEVSNITLNGTAADTYTLKVAADNALTITNAGATLQQVVTIAAGAQTVTSSLFGISFTTDSAFVATAAGSQLNGAGKTLKVDAGVAGNFLVSSSGQYTTNDRITIANLKLDTTTIGINASDLATSITTAAAALTSLDSAIAKVATAIGNVGAAQSRVDFASANVATTIENVASAESVIRDADLAFEMIDFTKNQILQQAGTAMLAQANATPQSVLSLLG